MTGTGGFTDNVLAFGRLLRAAGLDVHHGRLVDAVRALELVGIRRRSDVWATLRGLLVHRHEDLQPFDRVFEAFFRARSSPGGSMPLFPMGEPPRIAIRSTQAPVHTTIEELQSDTTAPMTRAVGAWSPAGVSRTTDFADFSAEELERACAVLARLPWNLSRRRTRRWKAAAHGTPALRRILRRNLMRGGDLMDMPMRQRRTAARPIVLICDVSGSMERYSRVLLHFAYGLAHSGTRVDAFVFSTRLTRITRSLASRRGRETLARLTRSVHDWGGGTRIGDALHHFNTQWARRVMRNGPVVVMVSDGWDRGDPAVLRTELARVRRSCRRLIWLNPLLGSATYEPLTRGMQTALRYVDDFLPVHNLESVDALAEHLRIAGPKSRPLAWQRTAAVAQGFSPAGE
jgi:uncharacterized protein with von Willebrand factor type A (vWA) domain